MHVKDWLFVALQKILPTRALSMLMYKLTRIEWPAFKNAHIRFFMRAFRISLREAEHGEPEDYATFNDFFTRALKPDARVQAEGEHTLVSPVDGTISQLGPINEGRIFQAKNHDFSVTELLGGDAERAAAFAGGSFCTIYLAPHNYHRIHMPADGILREWVYVPGRLFSVNFATVRALPGVFARNERVACMFDHRHGPWALVLVGALFVGSIETVFAGQISPPHKRTIAAESFASSPAQTLKRGMEMGRFNMGSTVILLLPPGKAHWHAALRAGATVQVGQSMGTFQ